MNKEANAAVQAARPTPLQALACVGAIIVVVAGYEIIGITLRVPALYMGFLFATYWGAIRGLALGDWLPAVLGALFGIALAFLLHALPQAYGVAGLAVALVVTMVAMFFLIRQQFAIVINPGFLVFLTVATIPALTLQDDHLGMAAGTVYGAIYAGALALLVQRLAARRGDAAAAAAAGSV